MNKKTIRDIDLEGKIVFARLDWNVPIKDGRVTDTARIEATRPTVDYLLSKNCRIIVASHLGRPEGKLNHEFSLEPVAKAAAKVLDHHVTFVPDCIGPAVKAAAKAMQPRDIICLENVRFHPQEEKNDLNFAKQMAADTVAEVYVYDAFASYRPHASTEAIAHVLPAVAGLLVEKEVDYITDAIEHPARPLVGIIGGAKVSTKLEILENLIRKTDAMLLTGPIANTFALAQGRPIGQSIAEREALKEVEKLQAIAKEANTELFIPEEVVVSDSMEKPKRMRTIRLDTIGAKDYIVDAAPSYGKVLTDCIYNFLDPDGKCTVIWNGPLGITEVPEYRVGSMAMAKSIIGLNSCTSIVGGGDTVGFVDKENLRDKFTWVSTGGGASLELMSGKGLPCVDALMTSVRIMA
jgi:phosphoglycerate kinase